MEQTFKKNIESLKTVNLPLYQELSDIIDAERFELIQEEGSIHYNLVDLEHNRSVYIDPAQELLAAQLEFKQYREYEFLYFFGIGNGNLANHLLEFKKLSQLVIIEPEIEILYIVLHLHDFSKALQSKKLLLFTSKQINFNLAIQIFSLNLAKFHARNFRLHSASTYYADLYHDAIIETSSIMSSALLHSIAVSGNSISDALRGVKHHIKNLPYMIQHPPLEQLQNKKYTDAAIVVSTGPSLKKQLPLLKKIQDYITIISVDASLPILEKEGIQPDFCTSIERVDLSAKFFESTSKEFMKNTTFINVSVQHERVLKALEGQTVVMPMRPFKYNRFFELDQYGYIGFGMSAANLAHELALYMGYRNVVLIGQDLAFGDDGTSHSGGHVFGANEKEASGNDLEELEAYGGGRMVKSRMVWRLFRDFFQQTIQTYAAYGFKVYNCTEGGARIPDTIEMPFQDYIDNILSQNEIKQPLTLHNTSEEEVATHMRTVDEKIQTIYRDGQDLKELVDATFLELNQACQKLENKTEEETLVALNDNEIIKLLTSIEYTRKKMNKSQTFAIFFSEITQSTLVHSELDLAAIKVQYVDDIKSNQKKALQWIVHHRSFLFGLSASLHEAINAVKDNYTAQ